MPEPRGSSRHNLPSTIDPPLQNFKRYRLVTPVIPLNDRVSAIVIAGEKICHPLNRTSYKSRLPVVSCYLRLTDVPFLSLSLPETSIFTNNNFLPTNDWREISTYNPLSKSEKGGEKKGGKGGGKERRVQRTARAPRRRRGRRPPPPPTVPPLCTA